MTKTTSAEADGVGVTKDSDHDNEEGGEEARPEEEARRKAQDDPHQDGGVNAQDQGPLNMRGRSRNQGRGRPPKIFDTDELARCVFNATCSGGIVRTEFVAPHTPGQQTPALKARGRLAVTLAMSYMANTLAGFVVATGLEAPDAAFPQQLLYLAAYLGSLAEGERQSQRGKN